MTQAKYLFNSLPLYILFFATLFFVSCTDDSEVVPNDNATENTIGSFSSGIFVVNEGNFGAADGSISFIDSEGIVQNDVFSENNALLPLGDVVQSMYLRDTLAFILVNNSNKVEVVDVDEMKLLHTISGVSLPRYMITEGDYGYISEWVSFTDPGRISILDLKTYEVLDTVAVGFGAEALAIRDNKLYVSNNFGSTLSVMDLSTREIIQTITVGPSPAAMIIDQNDHLWVVCSGGYNEDYSTANNGSLVQLDTNDEVVQESALGMNVSGKMVANADLSILYFYSGTTVYSYSIGDETYDTFIENTSAISFYGIGIAPDGDMYIGDSKGFLSLGSVYVYDEMGREKDEFQVGRGPNGFVFKPE